MSRDAVTEIQIENPVAREAFIRWWRTMEAQGYQYGFEALCNVWVGFDGGRADLAAKVLAAVSSERLTENLDNEGDRGYSQALDDVIRTLRELFRVEGVEGVGANEGE